MSMSPLLLIHMVFWMYRVRFRKRVPRAQSDPQQTGRRLRPAIAARNANRPDGTHGEGKSMSATTRIKHPAIIVAVAIALITSGLTIDSVDFSTQRIDRVEVSVETVQQGAAGTTSPLHAPDAPRASTHSPGSGVDAFLRRVPRIIAQQVLERILRESYELRHRPRSSKLTTDVRMNLWREFYLIISRF